MVFDAISSPPIFKYSRVAGHQPPYKNRVYGADDSPSDGLGEVAYTRLFGVHNPTNIVGK